MVLNTGATFQITHVQAPFTLRVTQTNSVFICNQSQDTTGSHDSPAEHFTTGSSIIPIKMTNKLYSQNIRSKSNLGLADLLKCHHQYITFKNQQNCSINCEFR